ncbi:MAG: tetratricopeptide repeat protein, partial [Myxococcota bacterium]
RSSDLFSAPAGQAEASVVDLASRQRDARGADAWVRLGAELEAVDPERACDAYRRAVELDPQHADAAINLGCLHHERGRLAEAEKHYRAALAARPDATGWFDLAVVLEDQGRDDEARRAYEAALASDAACAEAHFNLAGLLERAGESAAALRHLTAYRRLSR